MIAFQDIWTWLPALYLLSGGLGSGLFVTAAFLYFRCKKYWRRTIFVAAWTAFGCIALGLALLGIEAANPLRALIVWQSFRNVDSWMTYGAWALLAALLLFGAFALCSTSSFARVLIRRLHVPPQALVLAKKVCALLGAADAALVMSYTGFLLKNATGIPFWNSWLLPCLFVTMALSSGFNTVMLFAAVTKELRTMPHWVGRRAGAAMLGFAAAEAVVLSAFILLALRGGGSYAGVSAALDGAVVAGGYLATVASAQSVVSGVFAPWFWIFVAGGGVLVPGVLSVALLARRRYRASVLVVSFVCATVGEFALRTIVLLAGAHIDWVALTLVTTFFR